MTRSALLLALASSCAPAPRPPPALPHVADLRSASVALVRREDNAAFCGGTWMNDTDILTARHCVRDLGEMVPYGQIDDYDFASGFRDTHAARVIAISAASDLALLRASIPAPHSHAWASVAAVVTDGSAVTIVGHPMGLPFTYTRGTVSAQRSMPSIEGHAEHVVQVQVPAYPGSSGGAAFVGGEVVGVCSFTTAVPSATMFVHRDSIVAFLRTVAPHPGPVEDE